MPARSKERPAILHRRQVLVFTGINPGLVSTGSAHAYNQSIRLIRVQIDLGMVEAPINWTCNGRKVGSKGQSNVAAWYK